MDVLASMNLMDELTSMRFMGVRASMNLMGDLTSMRFMDVKASMKFMEATPSMNLMDASASRRFQEVGTSMNLMDVPTLTKTMLITFPHLDAASTGATRKAPAARVATDSEEEREIARDVKASQRHEAERMAATKAAKSSKDKGKSVVEDAPRKNPFVPTQAPREKLLGSSIVGEKARLSRESKTDSGKRKRESQI
ncbi:hypothetical protein R1sor_002903 [Riccia sorocarpa]|uniref:Uncharacterized protein n=1 Tax=Riccia sorocarpa TaxID=122646 RepID=A0ABD3H494_9MARC